MRTVALLAAAFLALALVACNRGPVSHPREVPHPERFLPPSILLITVEGLRADAVAGLREQPTRQSFTPNLDTLISEASWAGHAVAPSSSPAPAVASILTGLSPWNHQVLGPKQSLSRKIQTLAEAVREKGYGTTAYVTGGWLPSARGFEQGFDTFRGYGGGRRARGHLAALGAEPELVWIHFTEPEPPYRLPDSLTTAKRKAISRQELEVFRDRSVELPEGRRREIWRAYLQHVLLLDHRLGGLLEGLRSGGAWERTLIVVAAVHGEEFGEHGQMGHGNNLGRAVLDVPMIVRLPAGEARRIVVREGERPSTLRLWSTILEASGASLDSPGSSPGPALPPSLFREVQEGVLSEVYGDDGRRMFSFVEGDLQLIREVVPVGQQEPPFSGGMGRTTLWTWEGRGARELRRGDLETGLEKKLEEAWSRFLDRERTPEEERRRWSDG